jgi:hypothetical protein
MNQPIWPRVSLCIPVSRRPDGLRKLLAHVAELDYQGPLTLIVVDTDADLTAACRVAEADYVAVLGDDAYPATFWLTELIAAAVRYDADIVGGPVLSVFEDPSHWLAGSGLYAPRRYVTGPVETICGAGNMLIRRDVLDEPFADAFAFTGGGDLDFFNRCRKDGRSFAWADDARAFETVPRSRTTVSWLLLRGFRSGTHQTCIERNFAEGIADIAWRWVKGAGLFASGIALLPLAALRGRCAIVASLVLSARGVGRMTAEFKLLCQGEFRRPYP